MLGLDEAAAFFGGSMTSGAVQAKYLCRTYSLFEARPALNLPCQDKGMPLREARGY